MSELESGSAPSETPVDGSGTAVVTDPAAGAGSVEAQAPAGGAFDSLLQKPAEGEGGEPKETDAPQPVVPESYEFKASEGFEPLSGEIAEAATTVFKELGLTQEAADKITPLGEKVISLYIKQQAESWESQSSEWMKAAMADKEYGGEKLEANIARANAFMNRFASPELRTYLTENRIINHPELIRLFVKAGAAMSEDTGVRDGVNSGAEMSAGDRMYQYAGKPQRRGA